MAEDRNALNWDALVAEAVARRKAEGLTQADLAALAGVSKPTVVKFEKRGRGITLANAEAILDVLGLARSPGPPEGVDLPPGRP